MKQITISILSIGTVLACSLAVLAQSPERFYQNGKVGYRDKSGNVIVAPQYEAGSDFFEGRALTLQKGKRGFLDEKGTVVIPFIYDDASAFHEGLAHVMQNNKHGFINKENKIIPKYAKNPKIPEVSKTSKG